MHTIRWRTSRPLDLAQSIARFSRWGADPVNVAVDGSFYRVVDGGAYAATQMAADTIEISTEGDAERARADLQHRLAEELPGPSPAALAVPAVADQQRRMPGYRPPLVVDPFESLVTAITAQQVNLTWATTTRRRLVEAYGRRHRLDGVTVWGFPSPARLAEVDPAELRRMQFTTRKAEYIVGVARAAAGGYLDGLADLPDDRVIERLTTLRGIGRWSADWVLARCLGRGGVAAAGDLGVRKAVSRFVLESDQMAPETEVRAAVAGWGEGTNWSIHLLLERLAAG